MLSFCSLFFLRIPSFAIVLVVVNLIDNVRVALISLLRTLIILTFLKIIAFLARRSYAHDKPDSQVVEKSANQAEDLPHLEFE
jgi:hypothetical protein